MQITSDQIRAARALLRLDQAELARRCGVSAVTIRRLEAGSSRVAESTVMEIADALEIAGAEFVEGGVRHRGHDQQDVEATVQDIMAIAERSAERQSRLPRMTEADLYDENGLPV